MTPRLNALQQAPELYKKLSDYSVSGSFSTYKLDGDRLTSDRPFRAERREPSLRGLLRIEGQGGGHGRSRSCEGRGERGEAKNAHEASPEDLSKF